MSKDYKVKCYGAETEKKWELSGSCTLSMPIGWLSFFHLLSMTSRLMVASKDYGEK